MFISSWINFCLNQDRKGVGTDSVQSGMRNLEAWGWEDQTQAQGREVCKVEDSWTQLEEMSAHDTFIKPGIRHKLTQP